MNRHLPLQCQRSCGTILNDHGFELIHARRRFFGAGFGIHGPEIDEDLGVEGLLRAAAAPEASV